MISKKNIRKIYRAELGVKKEKKKTKCKPD